MVLLNWVINGLRLGSIYALVALGYNMVYGIVRLINFAHGDIIMVGAYSSLVAVSLMGLPLWASLVVSVAVCTVFGIVIEKLAYKPLRQAPKISLLITALGVSIFLQNLFMIVFKPDPRPFSAPSSKELFRIGTAIVDMNTLITIVVAIVAMILLVLLVKNTKMGKAMRAVSEDDAAARLMGVNVDKTVMFTFALGSGLAGLAAFFYTLAYPQVQPYMGSMPGLKAFVAAVLGGIGSIPGAMLGGFLLGIVESIARGVLSGWADAIVFLILILFLIIKPSGILGKDMREKV